jgi:glutathione S-transferase
VAGLTLYVFPIAPNPTRVRLYLAEKRAGGSAHAVEEVQVNLRGGEQRAPEHLARNPAGKLPVLELPDGSFLTESLAIIEYLEELWPEPPLIGRAPEERARVRELERIAELSVLHPIARAVHATRSPLGLPPAPEVAAHALAALPDGLARLDAVLADGRPFLAGAHPSVADCTLAAALQFARFGQLELPPPGAQLSAWDLRYRARPAARSVLSL